MNRTKIFPFSFFLYFISVNLNWSENFFSSPFVVFVVVVPFVGRALCCFCYYCRCMAFICSLHLISVRFLVVMRSVLPYDINQPGSSIASRLTVSAIVYQRSWRVCLCFHYYRFPLNFVPLANGVHMWRLVLLVDDTFLLFFRLQFSEGLCACM